ncbi:MAG: phage terminase large subunit [Lawsonibacter sp.]
MQEKELAARISMFLERDVCDRGAMEDLLALCLGAEDTQFAHQLNKEVRRYNTLALREDPRGNPWLYELRKKSLLFDAPVEFEAYLQYVEWDREPKKRFYMPRRKVLLPVVHTLQDLMDDKLDLVTISMPPGTGKSTLGIFLLSWIMGRWPDSPNLASAHSGLLTRSFYDGVSQIIQDPEYLWKDVFPNAPFHSTNAKEETIDLVKPHRFSTLTCRAIGASLTGATRCEKLLYADDLVSGIEEAMNRERLDKLWLSYTNDLKSRKKDGAKELHIATRWSVHDPIGRLEQEYGDSDRARFIVLPALDENGESNFNYAYGVGFSKEYFEDMMKNLDDASFRALFMNQPIEREGLLYSETELRRYFELPEGEPDAIISICDTKDKGTDYGFLPVAYQYGQDYYIEDCVCDNSAPGVVESRFVSVLLKNKVQLSRFESNSAGGKVAEKVQKELKEKGGRTHITTKYTTSNKETKIIINSPWVKEHCLFKDDTMYHRNSDYGRMMWFLTSYSMMGKNKHDDVPDGLAMLAEYAQSFEGAKVTVFRRPV